MRSARAGTRRRHHLDAHGRRADFHALNVTFGTNLVLAGVPIRVVQELMRHSDIRLTMKVYTDASKLPLTEGVAVLPSLGFGDVLGASCDRKVNKSILKIAND